MILLKTLVCGLLGFAKAFVVTNPVGYASSRRALRPPAWQLPSRTTVLCVNLNSDDPFEVLGIDPSPNLDKREIKRAYKRLALKYHPDVTTDINSTPEEKKRASDAFAKINEAYQTLSGKNGSSSKASSKSSSSSSQSTGYTPPHRRTESYASSRSTGGGVSWEDFMPKYDEETYDTGGDSFGAIFSDLFTGVAAGAVGGAAGGRGIIQDFIEFLEGNVDGYAGSGDDAELRILLRTGTIQEVGDEMDDTDLVVQQLTSKLSSLEQEMAMYKADLQGSIRFSERIGLEEKIDELEARKKIVQGYIKKARKRLVSLQSRYKELIVGGANDRKAGGRSSSTWDTPGSTTTSTGYNMGDYGRGGRSSTSQTDDSDDAWRSQGFGGSGRGSSSSRRRQRQQQQQQGGGGSYESNNTRRRSSEPYSDPPRTTAANQPPPPPPTPRTSSRPSKTTSTDWSEPPHRRTASSTTRAMEDKRRIREIQVDEEFDKLKKDLGID